MRRRSYTLTLAIVSTLALGACLFPSLDGLTGGDGGALDVSAPSDAKSSDAIASQDAGADADDADLDATADVMRTYVQEISADLPASWWRLGEADARAPAHDEMNAAPGVYQLPGVTPSVPGAIVNDTNTAMKFDGQNGAMYLSGSLYDFGGTSAFSIEVWVSPAHAVDASGDSIQRIVSHRTPTPAIGWRLYLDGTLRAFFDRWNNDVAVATVSTSKALPTNKFTHLVVTSDGTTLMLYENGVLESQAPAGATGNASTTALAWATGSLLNGEFFVGSLDEATIYAHPLSAARVLAHYNAGLGK